MGVKWPDYPKVEVVGDCVIIFYEDGSESTWELDGDSDTEFVVNDIRNGLKAIKFLRRSIDNVIEASFIILSEIGFSDTLQKEYLNEALRGIVPKSS